MFEKLILSKIHTHFDSVPLYKHQFSFYARNIFPKIAKIISFPKFVLSAWKKPSAVISLNISGISNHAWWPLLLHRFFSFNFPQYLLSIIKSYLTNYSSSSYNTKIFLSSVTYKGLLSGCGSWPNPMEHPFLSSCLSFNSIKCHVNLLRWWLFASHLRWLIWRSHLY